MKQVFVKVVWAEDTAKMEKTLNIYRVGLNDWDRTKVLNYNGRGIINYTIVCTQETYDAINQAMESC